MIYHNVSTSKSDNDLMQKPYLPHTPVKVNTESQLTRLGLNSTCFQVLLGLTVFN